MGDKRSDAGSAFRFRVSDSLEVPLRGHLLRLRVVEGRPALRDLRPGSRLKLQSPKGEERVVTISDHAVTNGRPSQDRLERTRELDVVISREDAGSGAERVGIGWIAHGPVPRGEEKGR